MNYRILAILVILLLSTAKPVLAASGLDLIDFTPMTPAHADSVDANFAQLEDAIPVMWASIDQDPNAVAFTITGPEATINDLIGIIVPDPGILLISGSVFINNDNPQPQPYTLYPLINGLPPDGHLSQGYFLTAPDGTFAAEGATLSYTYAVAVAASTYDITQNLGNGWAQGTALTACTYNRNNLTVVFFPSLPGGAPINTPPIPPGAEVLPPGAEDGDLSP